MFELTPFDNRDHFSFYRPFHDLEKFERAFFGGESFASFKTDIKDSGNSYLLEAELPGFQKEDISVDLAGETLTISARHSSEKEEKSEENSYVYRERSCGSFSRSFDVSQVRTEQIKASYENGVLKLELPKKDKDAPVSRKLEID